MDTLLHRPSESELCGHVSSHGVSKPANCNLIGLLLAQLLLSFADILIPCGKHLFLETVGDVAYCYDLFLAISYRINRRVYSSKSSPFASRKMSDALRPDGSLKDADEMEWYNDVDDDIPVSIPASSTPALLSSSSAQSLDNFFSSHAPAKKVSNIHQSSRTRKPSKRATDPDNAETGQKQKAGDNNRPRRVTRKVILSDSDEEELSDRNHSDSDGNTAGGNKMDDQSGDDEEFDEAPVQEKFDRLRALGDQDREVRLVF